METQRHRGQRSSNAGHKLLVEEHTPEGLRPEQPGWPTDPGARPEQGVALAKRWKKPPAFEPTALVASTFRLPACPHAGNGGEDVTQPAFCLLRNVGDFDSARSLDTGIVRTLWMTPDEVRASAERHRSPLVLRLHRRPPPGSAFRRAGADRPVFRAK